jgi:multiple sugar transport system permease protein
MEKAQTAEESKRRKRRIGRIKKTFSYIVLSAIGFTMILPFLWMVSTSLKEPGDVFSPTPEWIPTKNYIKLENQKLEVRVSKKMWEVEVIGEDSPCKGLKKTLSKGKVSTRKWIPEVLKKYYVELELEDYKSKVEVKVLKRTWEVEVVEENSSFRGLKKILPKEEVFTRPALIWKNYPQAWNAIKIDTRLFGIIPITQGFLMFYLNSIFVALCTTFGQVFTASLAAYAFARLKFPGRDKLFIAYLATMMIPGAVTMIPVFILMKKIAWVDTYRALIIPSMFTAYGTFLLRQFFMTLPGDLEDAAKIDGCNLFGIYWRIILPLSKPALATLTTFTFIGSWNNFMWPLIMINSMEKKTLPIGLASFQGLYSTDWTLLMAASVMVIIPVLIVFVVNQRFFVEGIRLGAIKG